MLFVCCVCCVCACVCICVRVCVCVCVCVCFRWRQRGPAAAATTQLRRSLISSLVQVRVEHKDCAHPHESIFKVPLSFTVCALTCPSRPYRTWVIFKSEIVKLWNCEFSRTRTLECRAWTYQPFRRLYHTKHCFFCESSCSNTLRRRDTERQIDREKKGEGGIDRDRDREKKREGGERERDWLTDWLNFYYTRIEVKAQILSSNLSLIQITNT